MHGVRDLLNGNPTLSYILYFNHIAINDPVVAAHIMEKIDPRHKRYRMAPASFSHTDPLNPGNAGLNTFINEANKCGIETIRTIQAHQVNIEGGYTEEDALATYRNLLRRIVFVHQKQTSKELTPIGCLISIEGHRSDDGQLGEPQDGILTIGKNLLPVVFVPLTMWYDDQYDRDGKNLGAVINLALAEPFIQTERNNGPTIDMLMGLLASELPENLRGRW